GVSGVADLKPYFVSRVAALSNQRGLALAGWEDGLMYDPTNTFNRAQFNNKRVMANAWDNIWEWGVADRAYRLANAGYEVIMSHATHLYFDHPYEVHPEERGYYWAARYTDTAKVFGYMPDNLYANADTTRAGARIENLEAMVGRELPVFFSSRRRHTRFSRDWSSDVCSSDLRTPRAVARATLQARRPGNVVPSPRRPYLRCFPARFPPRHDQVLPALLERRHRRSDRKSVV